MKKTLIGIGFIIVIFILFKSILFFVNQPCNEAPEKIEIIPDDAFWSGDCDEGYWFYIVNIEHKTSKTRIKIYNDYNGELAIDANFHIPYDCQMLLNRTQLKKNIVTYEGKVIITKLKNCMLKMEEPALGGYLWEIEKNINQLPLYFVLYTK